MTPEIRKTIYGLVTALVPLLIGFGWLTKDQGGALTENLDGVLIFLGALLSAATTLLARFHTPTRGRHTDNGNGVVDDAGFEHVPAGAATSDTKSDAAAL